MSWESERHILSPNYNHGKYTPLHLLFYSFTYAFKDRNELEREVFGGSESELSSDEDEGAVTLSGTHQHSASFFLDLQPQLQQKEQPRVVKPPVDDYESSGGDSEDDYEQQRPVKPTKKKRLSKKGPEDAERRPVQRKRKRKQPVEVDLSELPPEQGIFMLLLEFSDT